MGRLVERFWDDATSTARPPAAGDDDTMLFAAHIPHEIAQWSPIVSAEDADRITAAEDALREADAEMAGRHMPAEWLLRRAESAGSSSIEGVHSPARRLALAEVRRGRGAGGRLAPAEKEALNNIAATNLAVRIADDGNPVTVGDIRGIHAQLMEGDPLAGRVRRTQNWIGGEQFEQTPLAAFYVPPPPEEVGRLLEDLVACVNRPGTSPILHSAMVHAQFEAIHPFADGNGRTGRAVTALMLRRSGLTRHCTPPISSALMLRRDDYLRSLAATHTVCDADDPDRSAALSEWTGMLAGSAASAARYSLRVASHIDGVQDEWAAKLDAAGVRSTSAARRLAAALPSAPVLDTARAAAMLRSNSRTAQRALACLADCGIVAQPDTADRNRVYEAGDILDAFAAIAAGRPGDHDIPLPARNGTADGRTGTAGRILAGRTLAGTAGGRTGTALTVGGLAGQPPAGTAAASVCGNPMPRAEARCVLGGGHRGGCRSKR